MAFTKIVAAGIDTGSNLVINNINTAGVITASSIVATTGTFSGNVSVAGTITYEDVTNIDSVGVITARSGINVPSGGINVTGVITATSFIGDISQATGAAAGLGTALSQTQSSPLNKLYYTNTVLSIGSTITVEPPSSSNIAYTQYSEIVVEQGADLIVEDGDDLVPDILGLSTATAGPLSGAGGRVRADQFTNKAGTGAPSFPNGLNVTGVVTATSFSGSGANLTGIAATTNVVTNSLVVSGITTVAAGSTSAPSISPTGDSNTGIFFPSADTIAFAEGGVEAARFDSSGRLLLGTSTARSNLYNSNNPLVQFETTGSSVPNNWAAIANRNDAFGPEVVIGKSRGTTVNSVTTVQSGDYIGVINFLGADGTTLIRSASIGAEVDGTPGTNDMPGRLVFSTTADSASSPTERLRITSAGSLSAYTTDIGGHRLRSSSASSANNTILEILNSATSTTDGTVVARIRANGNIQTDGNIILSTSGAGIDFSAASNAAGMTSELLNDYEIGTYSPVMTGGGYTYGIGAYQAGRYTKIGRQVTVDVMINISTISGSSDGSSVRITLPFVPVDLSGGARWAQTPCRLVYFNSTAIQRIYCVQLTTNSSSLDLVYYYTSGGSGTDQPVNIGADYQSASNNGQIAFTISYITSS